MRPLALASLLALAACAADSDPAPEAPVTETVPDDAASIDPDAAETAQPEGSERSRAQGITSVYTDLDLDACEELDANYDEGWVDLRCDGYEGTDLFVSAGDLRYDVDAGVPNDRFDTPMAFNDLGDTVEWRLRDGDPFAVILRFDSDNGAGYTNSELAVLTVGAEGDPGCLIEWVQPNARPSQNEAARRVADANETDPACAE